ncbi:MAG TPA: hypothetical protein VH415_09375 [Nitrososphaeraceae archaeon]
MNNQIHGALVRKLVTGLVLASFVLLPATATVAASQESVVGVSSGNVQDYQLAGFSNIGHQQSECNYFLLKLCW